MKSFLIILFFLVIAGVGIYYFNHQLEEAKEQASQTVTTKPIQLPEAEKPRIQHPIPEPPVIFDSLADNPTEEVPVVSEIAEPLPSLGESDNMVKEVLSEIYGDNLVNRLFKQTGIIHRFVVTIDTLPQNKLANKFRLTQPASGKYLVQKDSSDNITVDPKNYARYSIYMQLLNIIDTEQFVKLYTRFYPLIQEAYDALGYKERYFNDRFIEVIDHLQETPNVDSPIHLVQPKVFYEYADPELEALSAGQKILLRLGPANMAIVKAKLMEIRTLLATPQLDE